MNKSYTHIDETKLKKLKDKKYKSHNFFLLEKDIYFYKLFKQMKKGV